MTAVFYRMVNLILAGAALAATPAHPAAVAPVDPSPLRFEGSLSRYDPGVMESVLDWRHRNGIPDGFDPWGETYDGYIAVVGCQHVGEAAVLWLTVDGVRQVQPKRVYVADCTTPGRPAAVWMKEQQIAAEVDHAAWQAWGIEDGRGAWAVVELSPAPDLVAEGVRP